MSSGIRNLVVSVPTEELAAGLGELPAGVELIVWPMDAAAPRDRFDIVVPPYMSMARVLEWLEGVEVGLVQGQSIGYDGVADILPDGLTFANAASVHETSTAELAVGLDPLQAKARGTIRRAFPLLRCRRHRGGGNCGHVGNADRCPSCAGGAASCPQPG